MVRKTKERPKAFLGAALAIAGLASSVIGQISASKKAKQQEQLQLDEVNKQSAANLTASYANDYSSTEEYKSRFAPTYAQGGGIKIDPSKRGTFKAQATRMNMGVQEAANTILKDDNKDKYSPVMRKKANFARNFAATGIKSSITPQIIEKRKFATGGEININDIKDFNLEDKLNRNVDIINNPPKPISPAIQNDINETIPIYNLQPPTKSNNISNTIQNTNINSFSKSFMESRASGKSTFMWNGKKYNTKLKNEEISNNTKPIKNIKVPDTNKNVNIISGGSAKPIAIDTYKLVGNKHGDGGIVIKSGKKYVEAEGGEVISVNKHELKILSTQPLTKSGIAPATKVLNSPSKNNANTAFRQQEQFKSNNKDIIDNINKTRPRNIIRTKDVNNIVNYNINTMHRAKKTTDLGEYNKHFKSKFVKSLYSNEYKNIGLPKYAKGGKVKITPSPYYTDTDPRATPFQRKALMTARPDAITPDLVQPITPSVSSKFPKLKTDYTYKAGVDTSGMSDIESSLAKQARTAKTMSTVADVANIAAPIISGVIGYATASKAKAPAKPSQFRAADLETTYNIKPQLESARQQYTDVAGEIDRSTASSAAALARKQRALNLTNQQISELYGQQTNVETQLRNQAALNKQQVEAQNVQQANIYGQQTADFANVRAVEKANALNAIIGGATAGVRDIQKRQDLINREDQQIRALSAGDANASIARQIVGDVITSPQQLMSIYKLTSNPELKSLIAAKLKTK